MAKKIKLTLSQLHATYLVKILENYADCAEKAAVAMGNVLAIDEDLKVCICADIYMQICKQDKKLDPNTIKAEYLEYSRIYEEAITKQANEN